MLISDLDDLPRAVPDASWRAPQANIPQTRLERERSEERHRATTSQAQPRHADAAAGARRAANARGRDRRTHAESTRSIRDYVGVLLSNEVWREQLATVPYERRLLLLPKCLRVEDKCPAPFDEFGLLCKQCGLCTIQDLQDEAERLGYAVLVAEGSALVMALIQTGKIEAIVGVSCLSVLERRFPTWKPRRFPASRFRCCRTTARTRPSISSGSGTSSISPATTGRAGWISTACASEVETWFAPAALDDVLGGDGGKAKPTASRANGWRAPASAGVRS